MKETKIKAPNIDDGASDRKPYTTKSYKEPKGFIFDICTYKGQRNLVFFIFTLFVITLATIYYTEVSRLNRALDFMDSDYQILIKLYNEK